MRKIAIFMAAFLCLALTSCTVEKIDVTSIDISRVAYEAEAEVNMVQDRIRDDDFWRTTYQAGDLIEQTLDDGKLGSVSFKLKTSEDETIILEDLYTFRLIDADDVWRELTTSQILYALVTSDEVTKAENSGVNLTVQSVILKWTDSSTGKNRTASVCDLNNDGHWDYVSRGKMYFAKALDATLLPADEDGYGIGNVSKRAKLIPVKFDGEFSELEMDVFD